MSRTVFELEGLHDLEATMMNLSKSINIRIAENALRQAGQPIADHAQELAPIRSGDLEQSIEVSKKLSRRQRRMNQKKSDVEVYIGPAPSAKSIVQEFGSFDQTPQPFMRPAWDAGKTDAMFDIRDNLATEIDKAVRREAKRQARLIAQAKR